MNAIVVYESHWGNTAAVALAIAEGIGDGARVLDTDEATAEDVANADLIVAGAPVIAFALPREGARTAGSPATPSPRCRRMSPGPAAATSRLEALPAGHGWMPHSRHASGGPPQGATGTIESKLKRAGYQ